MDLSRPQWACRAVLSTTVPVMISNRASSAGMPATTAMPPDANGPGMVAQGTGAAVGDAHGPGKGSGEVGLDGLLLFTPEQMDRPGRWPGPAPVQTNKRASSGVIHTRSWVARPVSAGKVSMTSTVTWLRCCPGSSGCPTRRRAMPLAHHGLTGRGPGDSALGVQLSGTTAIGGHHRNGALRGPVPPPTDGGSG